VPSIDGLTPEEAAVYNPSLGSYWDLHHCGKASDNHNWAWCWKNGSFQCQQLVRVNESLCTSGEAVLNFTHELARIDGCTFGYYAQYICTAAAAGTTEDGTRRLASSASSGSALSLICVGGFGALFLIVLTTLAAATSLALRVSRCSSGYREASCEEEWSEIERVQALL